MQQENMNEKNAMTKLIFAQYPFIEILIKKSCQKLSRRPSNTPCLIIYRENFATAKIRKKNQFLIVVNAMHNGNAREKNFIIFTDKVFRCI